MKARPFFSLCLFLFSILFLSCGDNEVVDIYGSISGRVTDYSTGNPIASAQVTLVPSANTVQTTDDGLFSFAGLDEGGNYTVSVLKDGYRENHKNVKVVSGEKTEIVIALKRINID